MNKKNILIGFGLLMIIAFPMALAVSLAADRDVFNAGTGLTERYYEGADGTHARGVYLVDKAVTTWSIAAAVGTTTEVVGIDYSDTVSYPGTGAPYFKMLFLEGCLNHNTGEWDVKFGVVTGQTASTGEAEWFNEFHFGPGKGCLVIPPTGFSGDGIDLLVTPVNGATDGELLGVVGNQLATAELEGMLGSGDSIYTINLVKTSPRPGDVLFYADETVAGSTLTLTGILQYRRRGE